MLENNFIFDEIAGKGGADEETRLFKELLEFEKQEVKKLPAENFIIAFDNNSGIADKKVKSVVRYAADSTMAAKSSGKSSFLISNDSEYALKYSRKSNEEIHITLICSNQCDTQDILLYSHIIDKYFIPNKSGEYLIGQYSDFNIAEFDFKAILPFEKISLLNRNNTLTPISLRNRSIPLIESYDNHFLKLKLNSDFPVSCCVISSVKAKDFIKFDGNVIEIPLMLANDISHVYIY